MGERDDEDWLDLIAGRAAPGAASEVAREAALVRASMLALSAAEPAEPEAGADEVTAGEQKLLDEARRQGLLPAQAPKTSGEFKQGRWSRWAMPWRWPLVPALIASAGLLLGITVLLRQPAGVDEPASVDRDAMPRLIIREVAEPEVSAQRLAKALQKLGLQVQVQQTGAFWTLETAWPDKPPPGLVKAWEEADLPNLSKGRIRILFKQANP